MRKILFPLLAVISMTIACNSDDEATNKNDPEPLNLSLGITLETEQDQIGDFANNAMAVFNGFVWSVGGDRPGAGVDLRGEVWRSADGVAWESVVFDVFDGRIKHTLTLFDETLWMIGGRDNDGDRLGEIWSSEDGFTWNLVTDTPPFEVADNHDVVIFNDRLYLIARSFEGEDRTSVWSSSNGLDWQLETDNAFSGREEFKAVVYKGAIYVIAGFLANAFDPTDEIWTSTNGTDWSLVETNTIFSARHSHTATVYNSIVFVAGGVGTSGLEGNLWYSEDMVNWFEYEPFSSDIGLSDHSALTFDDKLWLFGGIEGSGFDGDITGKIRSIQED